MGFLRSRSRSGRKDMLSADGDGAPRGAPDGDVISKAIEGKELDEEEQRRLRIMFQEMERRDRPWPTTGEHCFRITMAGLTRGGAPQPADNRIALDGQAYTWTQYVEADGDGAPRGAPDGDVIGKAIDGK